MSGDIERKNYEKCVKVSEIRSENRIRRRAAIISASTKLAMKRFILFTKLINIYIQWM
jgi:hypothetical protein